MEREKKETDDGETEAKKETMKAGGRNETRGGTGKKREMEK